MNVFDCVEGESNSWILDLKLEKLCTSYDGLFILVLFVERTDEEPTKET